MLKDKAFLLLILTFLCLNAVYASEYMVWVNGSVSTIPSEIDYEGATYYGFNFTVLSSNGTFIAVYPATIKVLAPLFAMADVALAQGTNLNLTGSFNVDGFFVVEEVNHEGSNEEWLDSLKQFWAMVGAAGKVLVVMIVQMVAAFAGITVPEWIVSLAVVAFVASLFLKLGKKLPMIIAVLMFFITVAVVSNLITTLIW